MNIKLVIADETKWVAYGQARVLCCYGYNNNASDDRYIQFHAKPAALLANGDVPAVASLYAPANAPFKWEWDKGIPLSELTIAVSSTQTTYTALTNTGLDMTVEVETDFPVSSTTTLVGDLTTGVNSRAVWSEASGSSTRKRLLQIRVKNNAVGTIAVFVSAQDSTAPADSTMFGPFLVATTETEIITFGRNGVRPFQKLANGTEKHGCTIYYSEDTAAPYSFPAGTDMNALGIYDV